MQLRFPIAAWIFFPESAFSADSLSGVRTSPRVLSHAFTSMRTIKILLSMSEFGGQSSVDYGNTKTLSMHRRLGSATLSQLAFPGLEQLEFPMIQF